MGPGLFHHLDCGGDLRFRRHFGGQRRYRPHPVFYLYRNLRGPTGAQQFAQLFEDAHKRKFDCVLFWALDRFTREGMAATVMYLQRLTGHGVTFHSYTEAHLSTDNELVGNILLAVMSSLAKVESQKIGKRTRAGMARARAQGKRIGRPALDPALQRKIAKQLGAGMSAHAVAKQLGLDAHTVAKYGPFGASAVAVNRRDQVPQTLENV
jgi:DNA invertase Pin-like site-specific DNA recombinase